MEPNSPSWTEDLRRQAATGCSGVAAIGVAQEFQRVWTASEGQTSTGIGKADGAGHHFCLGGSPPGARHG
jgi:hypothetical protein